MDKNFRRLDEVSSEARTVLENVKMFAFSTKRLLSSKWFAKNAKFSRNPTIDLGIFSTLPSFPQFEFRSLDVRSL